MQQKEIKKEIDYKLEELSELLSDRISELSGSCRTGTDQGQFYQASRHTFCYYRDFVFEAQELLRELKIK